MISKCMYIFGHEFRNKRDRKCQLHQCFKLIEIHDMLIRIKNGKNRLDKPDLLQMRFTYEY